MINKNELRIGNYFKVIKEGGYNQIGDIVRVTSVSEWEGVNQWQDMSASGANKFDGIDPISLTPEILLKCGFLKWSDEKHSGIYSKVSGCLTICWQNIEGSFLHVEGMALDLKHINHLHQLQNLYFALTGEELPFNT